MAVGAYFFDTYAFHEIISGNPNYKAFSVGAGAITTRMNLMELYYTLLKKYGKETAENTYDELLEYVIPWDDDAVKEAMEFKLAHAKTNLSYVDCVGYVMAQKWGVKFLTGDKEFEGMSGVEFVK